MSASDELYFSLRLSAEKSRLKVWKQIAIYLRKQIKGTLVDVGCGRGDFLRFANAEKKVGIDLYKSTDFPKSAEFIKADARGFGSKVKNADVVFASNLLEHFEEKDGDRVVSSVHSVLKKGGLFIVMQPNFRYFYKSYFDDYTHRRIFTDTGLCDYLRSRGFEIVKCMPRFLPATLKSRLPKFSFLIWLYLRSPIKPFAGQMLIIARKI